MEQVVRENRRKKLVGTVISTKNEKTITVMVETYEKHPLYSNVSKFQRNLLFMMKKMKQKLEMLLKSKKQDHFQKLNTLD